jgi:hypothetical protein
VKDAWSESELRPEPRSWTKTVAIAVALLLVAGAGASLVLSRGSDDGGVTEFGGGDRGSQGSEDAQVSASEITDVLPPDSIPSIDEPKFILPGEATFLADKEPVIRVTVNGDTRAYPLQIMTWHEIVNDEIGGEPVAVTFCPLCNTAIAFERPEIDGKVVTFGTSGKLLHSNLLMYDRATESLWAQATGVAVQGPKSGEELQQIQAQIVSWDEFRSNFPEGKVLSRDTGHSRNYGENPYPGYDDVDSQPFLFSGETDGRLAAVERVLGVRVEGAVVAYPYFRLEENSKENATAVNDKVGGEPVVVMWKRGTTSALDKTDISGSKDVGAAVAFSRSLEGKVLEFEVEDGIIRDKDTGSSWNIFGKATGGLLKGEELGSVNILDSFWFDWAAFHPDTKIWQGDS